jgi:biopolymer transport protein ExbB/TolQ
MPVWIITVQWISRSVLLLLFILSIWSVATMLRCSRLLKKADGSSKGENNELEKISRLVETRQWAPFKDWASQGDTLHAGTARVILQTASNDASPVDRAVKSYLSLERSRLEEGLTVLATLGSNAPFIGLFGTVLGIIQSFGALGAHRTDAADIMSGISEALIATAAGLAAAIPSVIAFNYFMQKIKIIETELQSFSADFLNIIERDILSAKGIKP